MITYGFGWFAPIEGYFGSRGGFGVHPEGNIPGTSGCVGIMGQSQFEAYNMIKNALSVSSSIPLSVNYRPYNNVTSAANVSTSNNPNSKVNINVKIR